VVQGTLPMKILIDTRIWTLGLKAAFLAPDDPTLRHASAAQSFLKRTLKKKMQLLFSSQLVAEIYHVLTQRGRKIPGLQARQLVSDLLSRKTSIYRGVSEGVFSRCLELSAVSGIHVWDYLVAFPFEDGIDRIYTMDPHFQQTDFLSLAQVENPIGPWKTEGQEL